MGFEPAIEFERMKERTSEQTDKQSENMARLPTLSAGESMTTV